MPSRLTKQQREKLFMADCIFGDGTCPDYLPYYPDEFPEVVVLIGSSRFKKRFEEIGAQLEKSGCLVLSMSFYQHADAVEVSPEDRQVLEKVDRARIDMADRVHVINDKINLCRTCYGAARQMTEDCWKCPDCKMIRYKHHLTDPMPYVGDDTKKEIAYAQSRRKVITYLNLPEGTE